MTDTIKPAEQHLHPLTSAEGMGKLLAETRAHVEATNKPDIITIQDPRTGAPGLFKVSTAGVKAIDPAEFAPWAANPIRRAGTATLTSIHSFIEHVNQFKTASTVLFASEDRTKPTLTAVYDYNERVQVGDEQVAEPMAQFGEHRAYHAFPLSDEWQAWVKRDATAMSMADFAAFLEDHWIDVIAVGAMGELTDEMQRFIHAAGGLASVASPTRLLALSKSLSVHESSKFVQAENLTSGEKRLTFQTEHTDDAGEPLNVPQFFVLALPVFRHGEPFRVVARLRYRKSGGSLVFFYELWRIDRVFDVAFREACADVEAKVGRTLFNGSPEVAPVRPTSG